MNQWIDREAEVYILFRLFKCQHVRIGNILFFRSQNQFAEIIKRRGFKLLLTESNLWWIRFLRGCRIVLRNQLSNGRLNWSATKRDFLAIYFLDQLQIESLQPLASAHV